MLRSMLSLSFGNLRTQALYRHGVSKNLDNCPHLHAEPSYDSNAWDDRGSKISAAERGIFTSVDVCDKQNWSDVPNEMFGGPS